MLKGRLSVLIELLDRFEHVNDPYVAERLYAVAYGCCLASNDPTEVVQVANVVYTNIFADTKPPTHILLRDYARGVIERALEFGNLLPGIKLENVRPPYMSSWPLQATLDAQFSEKHEAYWDIWWSVLSEPIGDFQYYVMKPAIEYFLAPNQKELVDAMQKEALNMAAATWEQFIESLSQEQQELRQQGGEDTEHFFEVLSDEQRFAFAKMRDDRKRTHTEPHAIHFDIGLASRWVFNRVLELGWTPQRFGAFDKMLRGGRSRDPDSERVGKKYQWIAFHELLAHLADHCSLIPQWDSKEPILYEGPWQLGVRDIDPSLLLHSKQAVWKSTKKSWWTPVTVAMPEQNVLDLQNAWLRNTADLPSPAKLIYITDAQGKPWLTLEGHYAWEKEDTYEDDHYDASRCHLWYQVRSYVIRQEHVISFVQWAKKQNWHGRWMPESYEYSGRMFLGEYCWHPSATGLHRQWEQHEGNDIPVPILVTSAWYMWEATASDRSLETTIRGLIPSSPLMSGLALSWQGERLQYGNSNRQVVMRDPSAHEQGPTALLIDYTALTKYLQREHLSIVWTVLGEKEVLVSAAGRLDVSGTYVLQPEGVQQISLSSHFVEFKK